MNVLVLGASGGCGREVVQQGLERGLGITAIVRRDTEYAPTQGTELIRGDVMDKAFLESVVKSKDAVISCLGLKRKNKLNPWSEIISPLNLTSLAAKHLSDVLNPQTKVAVISAAGVAESFDKTNALLSFMINNSNLGPAYQDLERMESILKESELDWHAARPVTLTDFSNKKVKTGYQTYGLFDMISRKSVASYLLDLIEGKTVAGTRTPVIKN